MTILEIKLAKNAEARRAVVAQILTYAAYLRGMDTASLERDILGTHLQKRGYVDLAQAVAADDQEGSFDAAVFGQTLASSLAEGRFRLVLVLDEAPPELVRLVGYVGAVSDKLIIDLVTVATYSVGGSQVVVPQRVDAEGDSEPPTSVAKTTTEATGYSVEGKDAFMATIEHAPVVGQPLLRRLVEWASELESEGLAKLWTYRGKASTTLLPHVSGENVGLVTIWNDNGAALSFWRTVFERRAPTTLALMEQSPGMPKIGQGNNAPNITDELLARLTDAYREAAGNEGNVSEMHQAVDQ